MKKFFGACLCLFLFSNFGTKAHALSEKYQDLTLKERETVFDVMKMDESAFFAENFIPFGVASFSRGDILTGTTVCLMDIATVVVVALGNGWTIGYAPIGYALGRGIGFYTMGKHIPEYNNQLKQQLGIDTPLSLGSPITGHIQLATYQFTF